MQKPASSVPEPLYRSPDPVDVPGAWFDQAAVDKVLAFGRFCRHIKGRWAGQPIEFEPWQVEHFIAPIFGWKHPNGLRIRRTGYLEVPKKSGKSTKASVLGLYLAGPDGEPGSEVYSAAVAKDQARIVFEPARLMVERSPALSKRYRRFANTIVYGADDGFFRVVSADARVQDGLNVHGAIIDEIHRHATRDLIDILEYGTAAREQPLVLMLTTAGEEGDATIYAEKHDYCIKVANKLVRDPTFHGVIYAAEPGDDWRAEETWEKANPGLDVTVSREYLRAKAAEADASPAKLNAFLRFHLNLRTKQTVRWHSIDRWDACGGIVKEESLEGQTCFAAFDVSRSQDINALILDFPREDGSHEILWRFWLPEDILPDLDERTSGMASRWAREGKLILTPGDVVDYAAIANQVRDDAARFDIRELAFNRRGASQLAQELQADGMDLVEMTTGISLAPAMQEWERLILAEKYRHGSHPVARFMFDGLAVKMDNEGNAWPDKGKSAVNISGPVAAAMAIQRSTLDEGGSVYESHGLLSL